jgi:hypothetical protein
MRWSDSIKAAEARWHAHRTAGIGAERSIAKPSGNSGGGAGGGTSGHAAGGANIHRCAVKGILAQDAEGNLISDRLADERCAAIK